MKKKTVNEPVDRTIYLEQNLETVMHDSMIPYSEHVILERAIPRVEDGLKPVQRRVLFVMYEQGLYPDKPFRKSANIVGETMAKYHPHGDSSIYETMVRLAQDFNMRTPLVEGNGNFGSMDGDSAAAFRYTEARLAAPALDMMSTLGKNTVSMSLNFDDTRREPDVLPSAFPNLLVNGATGIAVGLATSIPTHNPTEVIDGMIAYLANPRITLDEMMQYIPAPDFPTGGIIVNGEAMRDIYATGAGKVTVRARASIEPSESGRQSIVITEFPFQTNKAELLARILEHAQSKKEIIAQIHDIRDESDRSGVRAVIELKKGTDAEKFLSYLYKYTDLQKNIGVNMVAIAEGKPRQMGLLDITRYYMSFRRETELRRIEYDLAQAYAREEILAGLAVAAQNIDEVIAIIRTSRTPADARARLCERFSLTETQANAILEMKLRRITALEVETVEKELIQVRAAIAELEAIKSSKAKLNAVIRASFVEMKKKFGDSRRTSVMYDYVEEAVAKDAFKTVETAVVWIDDSGLVHRCTEKAFDALTKTTPIPAERYAHTRTDETVLLFGDAGFAYVVRTEDIPEGRTGKEKGTFPEKLISGFEDHRVLFVCAPRDKANADRTVVFATAGGMVKASAMSEFLIRRNKLDTINLLGDDRLLYIGFKGRANRVRFVSAEGKTKFYREELKTTGRKTKGLRGVRLIAGKPFVSADQEEND